MHWALFEFIFKVIPKTGRALVFNHQYVYHLPYIILELNLIDIWQNIRGPKFIWKKGGK